jgi:SAM-dependent methyltransferase
MLTKTIQRAMRTKWAAAARSLILSTAPKSVIEALKSGLPDVRGVDRTQELRKHFTKDQLGIEIGPYHNPVAPRRLGFRSVSLDVFSTEELRRRAEADPHIPREHLANIEDVDLQGSAVDIAELAKAYGGETRFDYVLSSHNFEHLPDPIRFLQGCERVLKPGGILTMAIPDRRFCFDFYRAVTDLSEWLDAYNEKRTRPTPGQVFRDGASRSALNGQIAWSLEAAGLPTPEQNLELSFADWTRLIGAATEGPYRDAHCSAFTPASFELLLTDSRYLGLLKLETLEISGPNGCEFYVHLRNPSGSGAGMDQQTFYRRRQEIMKRVAREAATVVV